MAKESVWTKLRRKVDKEFAEELQRQQEMERTAREEAKALEKQQKKEAAIAAYREKRNLTVADFFRIADLPLPDGFADIADHTISDFTADPRRLTPDSIFLYWGKSPISAGDPASVLQMAIDSGCLCVISNKPCAHPHTLLLPDTTDALEGTNRIREAYIKVSAYIRSLHKAKVITVTGSVGKTSTKEMIEAVLRQHYKNPVISKGNNNSMFSITRNIQSLKRTTNVYLQEVGAFAPKTIEYSARQLAADIAVYTNIGVSHIESYGSQEALTADKLSLSTFGQAGRACHHQLRRSDPDGSQLYPAGHHLQPQKSAGDVLRQGYPTRGRRLYLYTRLPRRRRGTSGTDPRARRAQYPQRCRRFCGRQGFAAAGMRRFSPASRPTSRPVCARICYRQANTASLRIATILPCLPSTIP